MLRLKRVEIVDALKAQETGEPEGFAAIQFRGWIAGDAHVAITVHVEDLDDEDAMIAAARESLRRAIDALHRETAPPAEPQSLPDSP